MIRGQIYWKKNALNVGVRLPVKWCLIVGVQACQNYQRIRSTMVIACVKIVF